MIPCVTVEKEPLAVGGTNAIAQRSRRSGSRSFADVDGLGAGLLMRSFLALRDVHLGLQPDHVLVVRLPLPADRYKTSDQLMGFYKPCWNGSGPCQASSMRPKPVRCHHIADPAK